MGFDAGLAQVPLQVTSELSSECSGALGLTRLHPAYPVCVPTVLQKDLGLGDTSKATSSDV